MTENSLINSLRIGQGVDIHRYEPGRKLVLGGVEIPSTIGLKGHSDADVLVHALMDSILGALGLPDIGHFFPNTDPKWKGANSLEMLEKITKTDQIVGQKKFKIINTDLNFIAETPKISSYVPEMKKKIAFALGVLEHQVAIKATTSEKLGFIGRKEGVMASVVTLLTIES